MRFTYQRLKTLKPVATLGGLCVRPRSIIPITVIGPLATRLLPGLVDPGSDDTVFPNRIATSVGIDLANCSVSHLVGVGAVPFPIRLAQVTLRVADNFERREWKALVGFTNAPLRYALLGYAGFLQFFTATFHGDREEVELTVNPTYLGT